MKLSHIRVFSSLLQGSSLQHVVHVHEVNILIIKYSPMFNGLLYSKKKRIFEIKFRKF